MQEYFCTGANAWPRKNVALGVSISTQEDADKQLPWLLQCPAAMRFVSHEPALGGLDMSNVPPWRNRPQVGDHIVPYDDADGIPSVGIRGINWLITGGESGPHARPMNPDWARADRDQCEAAGVPWFFKQHGEHVGGRATEFLDGEPGWCLYENGTFSPNWSKDWGDGIVSLRVGKKDAGDKLDGKQHHEFPKFLTGANDA